MKTTLAALFALATISAAHAQSGPPDAEVRALRATNSELMQAWVGARTALTATQDKLDIATHKIEELQTLIPRQSDTPMKLPKGTPSAPTTPEPVPPSAPEK